MYAIVDVETTGLDSKVHDITEIGIVVFNEYGVVSCYSSLNTPSTPLTDQEVCKQTGLSNDILAGHKINWQIVGDMLASVKCIIAHNAKFDKSFVSKYVTTKAEWLCSLHQIDWGSKGKTSRKLGHLCADYGWSISQAAHRAIYDCLALYRLLTVSSTLQELLSNAGKTEVVETRHIPYANTEEREQAKRDGWQWKPEIKLWCKTTWT